MTEVAAAPDEQALRLALKERYTSCGKKSSIEYYLVPSACPCKYYHDEMISFIFEYTIVKGSSESIYEYGVPDYPSLSEQRLWEEDRTNPITHYIWSTCYSVCDSCLSKNILKEEGDLLLMCVINSSVGKSGLVDVKDDVERLLEGVLRPSDMLGGSLDSVGCDVVHEGNPHLAHQVSELDESFRLALEGVSTVANTLDVVEDKSNLLEVSSSDDRRETVDINVPEVSEDGNVGSREGFGQKTTTSVLLEVTSEGGRSLPLETILVLRSTDERGRNALLRVIRVELGSSGDSIFIKTEAGDPSLELFGGVDAFLTVGSALIEVITHQEGNVCESARAEELRGLSSHEVPVDDSSKGWSRDTEGSGAVEDVVKGLTRELTEAVEGV
jgi:hypothetical protein